MGVIRRQSQSSSLFHGIVVFPYHASYAFLVLLPKQGIPAVVSAVPILISSWDYEEDASSRSSSSCSISYGLWAFWAYAPITSNVSPGQILPDDLHLICGPVPRGKFCSSTTNAVQAVERSRHLMVKGICNGLPQVRILGYASVNIFKFQPATIGVSRSVTITL